MDIVRIKRLYYNEGLSASQIERKPLSYKMKINLTPEETFLFQAALMLYWAEGAKTG